MTCDKKPTGRALIQIENLLLTNLRNNDGAPTTNEMKNKGNRHNQLP